MGQASVTPDDQNQYFGKDLEAMSFAPNYHRWLLDEFMPYIRGSVAEVGAGAGTVSQLLLEAQIDSLSAFEPSPNMFPLLQETLAADARATPVNGFFGSGVAEQPFDTIMYVNVLEHIEDDAGELVGARQMLSDDGNLLIFVPALPWLYSELDRQVGHYRRYTRKSLTEVISKAGFSIVKAHYFDVAGILPWYVHFTLMKNPIGGGSVSLYDRLVVPPMRVIEGLVRPPIGKNLLLVARKG